MYFCVNCKNLLMKTNGERDLWQFYTERNIQRKSCKTSLIAVGPGPATKPVGQRSDTVLSGPPEEPSWRTGGSLEAPPGGRCGRQAAAAAPGWRARCWRTSCGSAAGTPAGWGGCARAGGLRSSAGVWGGGRGQEKEVQSADWTDSCVWQDNRLYIFWNTWFVPEQKDRVWHGQLATGKVGVKNATFSRLGVSCIRQQRDQAMHQDIQLRDAQKNK